jgi:hypothetical protein
MKSLASALVAFLAAAILFTHTGSSDARKAAPGYRPPPPPAAPACVEAAVTGSYDSNWGPIKLQQSGNRITGTYECCGGGRIDGTISGNTIRYRWTQPGASGSGIWVVATTGELIGTWGNGADDSSGGWNLRRQATAACMGETKACLEAAAAVAK